MPSECPIHPTLLRMLSDLEHNTRDLNLLRGELSHCGRCRGLDCPTLVEFSRRVDQVLVKIRRDWKMP